MIGWYPHDGRYTTWFVDAQNRTEHARMGTRWFEGCFILSLCGNLLLLVVPGYIQAYWPTFGHFLFLSFSLFFFFLFSPILCYFIFSSASFQRVSPTVRLLYEAGS